MLLRVYGYFSVPFYFLLFIFYYIAKDLYVCEINSERQTDRLIE